MTVNGLVVLTFLPHPKNKLPGDRKGNVLTLLRYSLNLVSLTLLFTGAVAIGFLDPTLSLHLAQFNLTPIEVSLYFIITPVCHTVVAPFLGYIIDKKDGTFILMTVSCVTCALGFLMIGPTPLLPFFPRKIWFVTLGMVMFGLLYSCTYVPVAKCLIIGATELGFPETMRTFGMVSGLLNSVYDLGAFLGPTIGGALQQRIGFEYSATLIAAMFIVWFAVLVFFFTYCRNWKSRTVTVSQPQDSQTNEQELP